MAMTLLTESGRQAGAITDAGIGVVTFADGSGGHVAVSAIVTRETTLKLISWRISADGRAISRLADSGNQAGESHLVDLARSSGSHVVSAVKDSDGNLKVIAWHVDPATGAIARTGDSGNEGGVSLISMTESPRGDGNVIVAVATTAGRLIVKNFAVSADGHVSRVGDSAVDGQPSGPASRLALCRGDGSKVVTAVRDSEGNLKVIVWDIGADGHIKRLGDSANHAGAIDDVDVCKGLSNMVVTAVRDSGNNLKLIVWSISAEGAVTRLADSGTQAGGADNIACFDAGSIGLLVKTHQIITAVRTRELSVKLIRWQLDPSGHVTRIDDFGERSTPVDAIEITAVSNDISIVGLRNRDDGRFVLATFSRSLAPQPKVEPENLVLYDQHFFENTAQLLPPNFSFTGGRIVLHLGEPRPNAGFVYRELFDASNAIVTNPPLTKVNYPLDATTQVNATDNQLIRLIDGSLLAIKNGYTWADLSPRPAWFDKVNIKGQTSQRARNCVLVFHSSDGANWTLRSVIDSAVVFGGRYGWPQGDGTGGVGGFDRTEVYQDPFTGDIYVSGKGDGGPFTVAGSADNHKKVLLKSTDGGTTWTGLAEIDGGIIMMSSTPSFPLVAFQGSGTQLRFSLLTPGATSLGAPLDTVVSDAGNPFAIQADPGMNDLRQSPNDICRIGNADAVRISIPTLNASGRQVYQICNVYLSASSVSLDRVTRIDARDPTTQSCFLGSFVHDNANPASAESAMALFYWVEGPPNTVSPNDLIARYRLFRGYFGQYSTGTLSVSAGGVRSFARSGIGDYMKGGSFVSGTSQRFLAQWAEASRIAGNVVTVDL